MGLDVTFFAGNPSTRQARVLGQFRNTWWVVDRFQISDETNGCNVELTKSQIRDILADETVFDEKNGVDIWDTAKAAMEGTDWQNEKVYVNCWW